MPDVPLVLVWPDDGQPDSEPQTLLADVTGDVITAAWDASSDDAGRTALLTSIRDARSELTARGEDPDELVLVGFGSGATAAAGLTRYAKRLGIGLGRVIAVEARWDEPDPFSGGSLTKVPAGVELVPDSSYLEAAVICSRPH